MKTIQLLVSFCLASSPLVAVAESPASQKDLARNFFDQGIRKVHDGECDASPIGDLDKCREAREMFSRAHDLDPDALGTLRNLAQLEQRLGLLASSVRHYRELARKAPLDAKPERRAWAKLANSAIAALQPRLAHVTLAGSSPPPDTQVKIDKDSMPAAEWGAPLEIDPGQHAIEVQAPGHIAFEEHLDLSEGENRTVRVELTPVSAVPSSATPVSNPPAAPASADRKEPVAPVDTRVSSTRWPPARVAPWIAVGAGGLAIGVAGALGVAAMAQRNTACPEDGTGCNRQEYDKGAGWADASTVLFIVGGTAVAGGLVWHFVTRSRSIDTPPRAGTLRPSVGPVAFGLTGYFE